MRPQRSYRTSLRSSTPPVPTTPLRRIAYLSLHTSPLEKPGTGDAGGMNVYILNAAKHLAKRGINIDIFTRATDSRQPAQHHVEPGITVHHLPAGPYEHLNKNDLPAQLCEFTHGLMRYASNKPHDHWDLIHSHYWLSGQIATAASTVWNIPMIHTFHTLAKTKHAHLSNEDTPEPDTRIKGEQHIADFAARLHANTTAEASELTAHYGVKADRIDVIEPGVDLSTYFPNHSAYPVYDPVNKADSTSGRQSGLKARNSASSVSGANKGNHRLRIELGIDPRSLVILFAGRIQPAKGPHIILNALAHLADIAPDVAASITPVFVGGASNANPDWLPGLAATHGLAERAKFLPPRHGSALADMYRMADIVAVPSFNESFGLVALEAQACGTPVLAANVGGLATAVAHGKSGLLVDGHDPHLWAEAFYNLATNDRQREILRHGAAGHASRFSWDIAADAMVDSYMSVVSQKAAVRQ